jgi:hypothetical protein
MNDVGDKEVYLGDGLYASFDGWMIRLRAPREGGDHEIFLEDDVCANLVRFVKSLDDTKRREEAQK